MRENCKQWLSFKAIAGALLCLAALACALIYQGLDLLSATIQTGVVTSFVFLGIASRGKSDRLWGVFIMALMGFSLIYNVIDDFYKAIQISAGLFLLSAAFNSFVQEVGNPDAKLLAKIYAWVGKTPEAKSKGDGQHKEG